MVFLEIISLLDRWNYGFFHSTVGFCRLYGCAVLPGRLRVYYFYHCQKNVVWRSHFGLAVFGVYYLFDQRRAAFLPGNCGAISCKNVYGSKKKANLSYKGRNNCFRQGGFG